MTPFMMYTMCYAYADGDLQPVAHATSLSRACKGVSENGSDRQVLPIRLVGHDFLWAWTTSRQV